MSREILFKAKRANWMKLPKEEWWVEGSLITGVFLRGGQDIPYILCPEKADYDCLEDFSEENGIFEVDPETVCRYTGLTNSKDGRKFCEGDIVLEPTSGYIGVIRFGLYKLKHYGFYVDWIKSCGYRCDIGFWVTNRLIRTISNIFDNPEFLKEGQQPESPITHKEDAE